MLKLQVKLMSFYFLILVYFTIVESDCILNYPSDFETIPRYEKHIGKYKLQIPYNGNKIQTQDGEIINAYCDTHFRPFQSKESSHSFGPKPIVYHNHSSITLNCSENKFIYDNKPLGVSVLECAKLNWSIYATDDSYSWCEKYQNSTTFLLATKSNVDQHILAGICYNLEQLSLKTVTYNVTYYQRNYMKKLLEISKINGKSQPLLGDDLWNFKTTKSLAISSEQLQLQLSTLGLNNFWLQIANYDVSSIVQGDSYGNYFKEYSNILDIIWWRNLRMGNWKSFMITLENYAYNNSFQLYTGSSGVVRYPNDSNGDQNNILEIKLGDKNDTIPAYIWTYLKSNDRRNKDFIIVGYNSPYAEFFGLENIIFCPDICSQIPWLDDIYSSFHFATAGIMFCCSTDFIRQTHSYNEFPVDILQSRNLENTAEIELSNTNEFNSGNEFNLNNASPIKLKELINNVFGRQ